MNIFTYDTEIVRGSSFSRGMRYSTVIAQSTSNVIITNGAAVFAIQAGLSISPGQRIRASLAAPPVDDATQFVEGVVASYTGTTLTLTIDTTGGNAGATYSSWQLATPVDLTGGTFNASMSTLPDSCAGRSRTPVTITVNVTGDPTRGVFALYLTPVQTAALTLGVYNFKVLFTPSSSSDKFLIVSGTTTVTD
jgi:hypothetical protein